jgi:hypothetical protein
MSKLEVREIGPISGETEVRLADGATAVGFGGGMPTVTLIKSSGTWTNNGAKKIKVEVIGGGAGGGGGHSRGDAQYGFGANGGGAGGYSMKVIDVSSIQSASVVVGSKGSGGGSQSSGGNGGQSSWNDGNNNLISEGGIGGNASGHNESTYGGEASGGDINIKGGSGECGFNYEGAKGGMGGIATKSYGSPGVTDYFGELEPENRNAIGHGHGGGGACSNSNNKTGGDGADGLIIITEY